MAERRKIIIETGAQDEPLPTPHFDTEATLTARPVVPLTDQEIHQTPYGARTGHADARPFWKRPALLALIVLAAVGVGVAAGLAIGVYRNRQVAETPVAAAPSPTDEDLNARQVAEAPQSTPAPQEQAAVVAVPDETEAPTVEPPVEPAVDPKSEERERTARNERPARKDDDDEDEDAARRVEAKPSVARTKKPVKVDEYVIEDEREERRAERAEQRREERRADRRERRRRHREEGLDVPSGIERAGREVNRIREIFEGRQP
jgi:hypothetical protein